MTRPYSPWTNRDWKTLEQMARAGRSNRQIAEALGRSYRAIACRARKFRPLWRARKFCPQWIAPPPAPVFPTIRIVRADVVAYYALGWRFAGFEEQGSLCLFVWPHAGEARHPVTTMLEAA